MKTLIFLTLINSCFAASVNLEWDQSSNASLYHVREKIPNSVDTKFVIEVTSNKATVNVQDGAILMVAAGNDFGWSEFSEPVTIKLDPIKPLPVIAFKIEYGDNLTGWETKMFFVQDKARLFARVKVTPVQIYLTPETNN